ncbi:hypothetical protein AN958_09740 [Leucoagaricus sp. SymC.cos]|nr:hypothetical protein AN958_09740 [Leucoagaricus sp. SymC.cos]
MGLDTLQFLPRIKEHRLKKQVEEQSRASPGPYDRRLRKCAFIVRYDMRMISMDKSVRLEEPSTAPTSSQGFFNNANNVAIDNSVMNDYLVRIDNQNVRNVIFRGKAATVLELVTPTSNAEPSCIRMLDTHTLRVMKKLTLGQRSDYVIGSMVCGETRDRKVCSRANFRRGVRKEISKSSRRRVLSRANGFNDHTKVIPTLSYQLVVKCPVYKTVVSKQLTNGPKLLDKAPPTLLKKLIVDLFLKIQAENPQLIRAPLLILLDGLDECHGENSQCELVEMIAKTARVCMTSLPLRLLIVSRPEEHLKYAFADVDVQMECGLRELLIDGQCREDVCRVLRDGFAATKKKYRSRVSSSWPPTNEFKVVERTVDGLFVFAETVLKDIESPDHSNPAHRPTTLVSFLDRVQEAGTTNPLEALDKFYIRILNDTFEAEFSIPGVSLHIAFSCPASTTYWSLCMAYAIFFTLIRARFTAL